MFDFILRYVLPFGGIEREYNHMNDLIRIWLEVRGLFIYNV
jgi:hypothetical protein